MILRKGDIVRVTYGERALDARVFLASPNGRSLLLAWDDGMLGGHVGMMPVLQDETTGLYFSLIEGKPVALERKDAPHDDASHRTTA